MKQSSDKASHVSRTFTIASRSVILMLIDFFLIAVSYNVVAFAPTKIHDSRFFGVLVNHRLGLPPKINAITIGSTNPTSAETDTNGASLDIDNRRFDGRSSADNSSRQSFNPRNSSDQNRSGGGGRRGRGGSGGREGRTVGGRYGGGRSGSGGRFSGRGQSNQQQQSSGRGIAGRSSPPTFQGSVLRLQNPMNINRVVDQMPAENSAELYSEQSTRRPNNNNNNANQRGGDKEASRGSRGPRGSVASTGIVNGSSDGPAPEKDFSRRRTTRSDKPLPQKRGTNNDDSEGRKRGVKTSLRLGTSRKGRGAEVTQRRSSLKKRDRRAEKEAKEEAAVERKTIFLPEGPLTVSQLADLLGEKPVGVIKFLMSDLGVMASMTQSLDPSTCVAVVEGFGKIVAGIDDWDEDDLHDEESALATGVARNNEDDPADLVRRPPVVTIMGHVDHGKTSLLDAIRSTDVTAGEAGGITQHIAAYQVNHEGNLITFIDTPGHAAFTDMRERGANITDMVILVVAADDGVKQQTADSIMCARQAGVPLIVAINKCDKETADPVRVQTELTQYEVLTEDFGGETLSSQISAKEKTNLNDLMDKIMLQAELEDLKANPNRDAEGIVIEALVERGLGTVATTLIKRGTLRVGDVFVAGETYGKIRALLSTTDNTRLSEAGPSTPVRVVGFEGIPAAGDILVVAQDEQTARDLAESRQRIARELSSSTYQTGLMDSVNLSFGASKQSREMCVVVKADVQGTAEALTRALRELKLENDEAVVTVKVLVSETGEVTKSDIVIASVTPGTTVIAFNVAASISAMDDARSSGVSIEYYNIIYDAIESVESRMQEVLSPTPDGEYSGSALVQEVFNIGGTGNIAGSRCTDGILKKGANVRVLRGDKILVETKIKTLRNFKAETDSVEEGNECGIGLLDYEDFEAGDVIECYIE